MAIQINRPAHIATLIDGVDRYNPSNLGLLEEYLREQLADNTYDLLANLALLKLYQFNPSLCSPTATLSILFLALAHAPFSPDFALAWSLLSDSFVLGAALPPPPPASDDEDEQGEPVLRAPAAAHGEKETAERLKEMSGLLLARKFKAFWTALKAGGAGPEEEFVRENVAALLASANGFEARLRDNVAVEIEASFRGLALKTLESFLGLEGSSSLALPIIESHKWTVDGSNVKIPANESNSPTSTLQREHIEIEQLSKLLGRSQAA